MKQTCWLVVCEKVIYGPFKSQTDAAAYALQFHGYGWSITPVWRPLKSPLWKPLKLREKKK